MDRVREMTDGSVELDELAEMAEKDVQTAENIRMSSASIQGAGREPGVIGTIFSMSEGELSTPVEGESAVFVLRVNALEMANIDQLTETERNQIRSQLEQQKVTAFNQVFVDELKEDARITDNRSRLLR